MTKYISDSRKAAYIDTAKEAIGSARNLVNSGEYEMYDTNTTYYISIDCIKTENALKSPYGEFASAGAFVVVTFNGKGYDYYWTSVDENGQGIKGIVRVDNLSEDDIESDLSTSDIRTDRGIDGRKSVVLIQKNNNTNSCEKTSSISAGIQVNGATGEESKLICKRATVLHSKKCNGGSCKEVSGIGNGGTITYGQLWDGTSELKTGDALDCDVTDTGNYERFYYVSSVYDTNTNSFDNSKAVLIYYENVSNNGTTLTVPSRQTIKYCNVFNNLNGPNPAYTYLPTTEQWSNSQIITPAPNRKIVNQNGGTTTTEGTIKTFTYGTAARFLTAQELMAGCPSLTSLGRNSVGDLTGCLYVLENLGTFEQKTSSEYGFWLETPTSYHFASIFYATSNHNRVESGDCNSYPYYMGVRPVIEVLKINIAG